MAGSPLYTNKDAERQYWMRGPWKETTIAPAPGSAYDDAEAARERAAGDAALASAKRFLSGRTVADEAQDAANRSRSDAAADRAAERLTLLGRIKAYGAPVASATARVGIPLAAGAFAPVGAGLLTAGALEAGGNVLGDAASRMFEGGEQLTPGDVTEDAVLGAAPFAAGPVLKGVGKGMQAASDAVPASLRGMFSLGGMISGHPAAMAAEAVGPVGRGLEWSGNKIEQLVNAARNALWKTAPEAEATAERFAANTSGYRATGPRATGRGAGIPYQEPTPYTRPSGVESHAPNTSGYTANGDPIVTERVPYARPTEFRPPQPETAKAPRVDVDRYMPNVSGIETPQPASIAVNGSGESGASLEALNRLTSMKANGKQFGVFNRSGEFRPLIGPDAVDYVPMTGETFGVNGPNGFQVLTDNGGKVTRVPMGGTHPGSIGNEYTGVQPYGPSTKLTPEESAVSGEFWDSEINNLIQGLLRATGR